MNRHRATVWGPPSCPSPSTGREALRKTTVQPPFHRRDMFSKPQQSRDRPETTTENRPAQPQKLNNKTATGVSSTSSTHWANCYDRLPRPLSKAGVLGRAVCIAWGSCVKSNCTQSSKWKRERTAEVPKTSKTSQFVASAPEGHHTQPVHSSASATGT